MLLFFLKQQKSVQFTNEILVSNAERNQHVIL